MTSYSTTPQILLVEDDPTTRTYLIALTKSLPAHVDAVASVAEAVQLVTARQHDLWLIDANLPDGDGIELLNRLRIDAPDVPAIAHTAAQDVETLSSLHAAGFLDVLAKPVNAATWRDRIAHVLEKRLGTNNRTTGVGFSPRNSAPGGSTSGNAPAPANCVNIVPDNADNQPETLPLWDDAAAARALGGNSDNVAALRTLFLAELPLQLQQIRDGNSEVRSAQLHRLRASCAFVGASRLEQVARRLETAADHQAALDDFVDIAQRLLRQMPEG